MAGVPRRGSVHLVHTGLRDVLMTAAATVAVLGGAWAVGAGGWPGEPSGCIAVMDCYCEAFTQGVLQQPVNTLSNFGFVLVGLWILGATPRGGGSFSANTLARRIYGLVGVFLGVGSMMFHASMTEWGGWVDLVSMHLFITYLLLYDVAILSRRSMQWFVRTLIAANAVLAVVLWVMDNGYGKFVFGTLIAATLAVEYRLAASPAPVTRDRRWLWASLASYGAGQFIWVMSRDGAPWCDPDSLIQGHAVWHLTSAATVWLVYRYLTSEDIVAPVLERRSAG